MTRVSPNSWITCVATIVTLALVPIAPLLSQSTPIDSLLSSLSHSRLDTNRVNTLLALGATYLQTGDYAEALEYYHRSLRLYHAEGDRLGVIRAYSGIGSVYQQQEQFALAAAYMDSSLVLAKEINAKTWIAKACKKLSRLYYEQGEFEKAFVYQKEYLAIKDTILNEENLKQVNELTIRYEAERKEKQIALLEKDRQIGALELQHRDEELVRQGLIAIQHGQQIDLLERDREIQDLELDQRTSELALNKSDLALNRAENEKKQREIELQTAEIEWGTLLRNAVIVVFILFVIAAGLGFRSLRDKRRATGLRAESAEYKARAAEARTHELRAESERKEKEIQGAFTRQLIASQEQERKRIAGALHDGIGQDLLIIKHRSMMALEDDRTEKEHLNDILEVSSEAIDDVRRMSRDLRPYQLERVGLTATLRSMLNSVAESTHLQVSVHVDEVDGLIAPEQEIDLYRVVQEGVNNIMKHAEAKSAEVSIRRVNGSIMLTIRDDGKGFDLEALRSRPESLGLGLQGMTERIQILGGSFNLESAPGNGTTLSASIPLWDEVSAERREAEGQSA